MLICPEVLAQGLAKLGIATNGIVMVRSVLLLVSDVVVLHVSQTHELELPLEIQGHVLCCLLCGGWIERCGTNQLYFTKVNRFLSVTIGARANRHV